MKYYFGKKSLKELKGVKPQLQDVVNRALAISIQDFAVHDGLRTLDEQRELVQAGASKTLASKHLTGDAVDLVPYVNGKLRWEWEPIYAMAHAVQLAARELGVKLRWGGAWDVDFTHSDQTPSVMVAHYVERRRSMGKRAFIDGPHFELVEGV